jgi:hypothetical protein
MCVCMSSTLSPTFLQVGSMSSVTLFLVKTQVVGWSMEPAQKPTPTHIPTNTHKVPEATKRKSQTNSSALATPSLVLRVGTTHVYIFAGPRIIPDARAGATPQGREHMHTEYTYATHVGRKPRVGLFCTKAPRVAPPGRGAGAPTAAAAHSSCCPQGIAAWSLFARVQTGGRFALVLSTKEAATTVSMSG